MKPKLLLRTYFFIGMLIAVFLCTFSMATARSQELEQLTTEYIRFHNGSTPYMTKRSVLKEELNLTVEMKWPWKFYTETTIHSQTDQDQFRLVGLKARFGLRFESLSFGYYHFSRHTLDKKRPGSFNEDGLYLKMILYKRK